MHISEQQRTIYLFDILRGIAAIYVVAFHLNILIKPLNAAHGYLAVDLFFIMSGCVIELAYAHRLRSGMTMKSFFTIRFIRLYPIYILGTTFSAGLVIVGLLAGKSGNWTATNFGMGLIAAILLLPFPARSNDNIAFPLNPPAYSLFYEAFVNIIYVLLFKKLTDIVLKVIIAISATAIMVIAATHDTIDIGYNVNDIALGISRAFFGFFFGVYIARKKSSGVPSNGNIQCLLILLFVIISFTGQNIFNLDSRIWDLFFILIGYPIVVRLAFSFDLGKPLQGIASYFGRASYAVYALHLPFFALTANAAHALRIDRAALAPYWGLGVIAVIFAISLIVDRWFDMPVRQRLKRWLGPRGTSREKSHAAIA